MQKHIQYAHYSVIKIKNTFKYKIGRNFLNVVVFLCIHTPDHRPHDQHTKIKKHITDKRHRKYKMDKHLNKRIPATTDHAR